MSSDEKFHPRAAVRRARLAAGGEGEDAVVVEEPLEIQLDGETLAITMRTPGSDEALTAGFLFAEGRIRSKRDVRGMGYVDPTDELAGCNTMNVMLCDGAARHMRAEPVKRGTVSTTSCGVCGRQTIADLLDVCSPQDVVPTMALEILNQVTAKLAQRQPLFAETGGCHAAAILDVEGNVLAAHEDVGRHNAVDKSVGELVFDGMLDRTKPGKPTPRVPTCLVVSGRVSFEIVQKAAVAGIPVVASVSAASSLAIDLAQEMGITLAAFVRDGRSTVYCHPERLTP
jgi:FdhD protein